MAISKQEKEQVGCPYISNTFLRIFDDYMASHLKTQDSRREYRYVVYALCNHAARDFLDIGTQDIRDFLSGSGKGGTGKPISYNFRLRVITAIFRYMDENAANYSIIPRYMDILSGLNPELPDPSYNPAKLPALKDIDSVLQYFKADNDITMFLACSLALRCSLTVKELAWLEKSNLFQDLNGNYGIRMKISDLADRFVKIPDDVAETIPFYIQRRRSSSPSLLVSKRGTPISIRTLQQRLHKACLECGIPPFSFNDLRVLSVSYMLKGGARTDQIAEHIDLKNTDWCIRYNRVVKELDDSAVDYSHIRVVW